MNILDYIKGKRQGKEANRLEKEAMRDPFLREALEGYEPFDDGLADDIAFLQSQVMEKATEKKRLFLPSRKRLAIAASYTVLVVGSFLIYLFMNKNDDKMLVMSDQETQEMIVDSLSLYISDTLSTPDFVLNEKKEEKKSPARNVQSDPITTSDFAMNEKQELLAKEEQPTYSKTVIDIDRDSLLASMEKNKKNVSESLSSADGVSSIDGEIMSVRGNRSEGQVVVIDGVRVRGSSAVTTSGGVGNDLSGKNHIVVTASQIAARFNKLVCPDLRGRVTVSFSINANGEPGVIHAAGTQCEAFERELRRVLKDLGDLSGNTERIVLELDF